MQNKFTQKAQNTLRAALTEAGRLGHMYVGSEHLLLALVTQNDCIASRILLSRGLSVQSVRAYISELCASGEACRPSPEDLTEHARSIIESAASLADERGCTYIGTEHLLLALLLCEECTANKIIARAGLVPSSVICDISSQSTVAPARQNANQTTAEQKKKLSRTPLALYAKDLCSLAEQGKTDRLIGREAEIERTLGVLCRKNKNNPCLIGEPGVGKTAIVEGLAARIVSGDVPTELRSCKIFSLDISSMLAGAKYRGEFEERMKNVLSEIESHPEIILFIDELHVIVGAGSAEGAVDAGNILKPVLARGGVRVIGATTLDEYRKHIERDAALCRRFAAVRIEEPTPMETEAMLFGLRECYEAHHRVNISPAAISAAVAYSTRYICDRFLPDKALDLIDESAARLRLSVSSNTAERPTLAREHIAHTVSLLSGISEEKILGLSSSLLELEENLNKKVVGQNEAIDKACSAIRRASLGLCEASKPLASFIFLGASGVGKSALAAALSEELFGSRRALLKFDMSEYTEVHSISKLIGSPPGYVGYGEGGVLCERVHRRPYSVVLFDGLDKAHPDVLSLLLPIVEEGVLCDARGKQIDFKNTVVIATLSAEALGSARVAGFSEGADGTEIEKQSMLVSLKKALPNEFLSKFDEIVFFYSLKHEDFRKIADMKLRELCVRAEGAGLKLTLDASLADELARRACKGHEGAREIEKIISREIENTLADKIISKAISGSAALRAEDGKIII